MEAEQTTLKQEALVSLLLEKEGDIKALRKRVTFLEARLKQRSEKTKKDFAKLLPYFKTMRRRILKIFLDMPTSVGLSHQEIIEEFRTRFPRINTAHIPRRVRELVTEEKKLWSKQDEEGTVRFYLLLKK